MGKGTGQVARLSERLAKPCVGLAGQLALGQAEMAASTNPFHQLAAVAPDLATEQESMVDSANWLERLARRLAKDLPPS